MKPAWLVLGICSLAASAVAEQLPPCHGMQARARALAAPAPAPGDMAFTHQAGQLLLGVRSQDAYFSPEFGVILEDATGAACQLRFSGDRNRGLVVSGAGQWSALEAGVCSPADGSCTPVRIEFPVALQTRPRR